MKKQYLLILALFCLFARVVVACTVCEGKIEVRFSGNFCANGSYSIELSGSGGTATATGSAVSCAYGATDEGSLKVRPNEALTLTVPPAKYSSYHLQLNTEDCYKIYIDGDEVSTVDGTGEACDEMNGARTYTVVIVPKIGPGSGSAGSGGGGLNSLHWRFDLGGLSGDRSAGSILISEGVINSASYTPAALNYYSPFSEVETIRDSGILRQVKTPECLADIVTISPQKYEIRYYTPSNTGTKSGGVYVPVGSPFVIWTVENPVGGPVGKMLITESRGSINTVSDFNYDSATKSWTFTEGGRRSETLEKVTLGNGDQRITRTVIDPTTNVVALKTVEIKHEFPWGWEVIQRIENPDGDSITTNFTFDEVKFEGPNNDIYRGGYGKLKWFVRTDGYWESYEYSSAGTNLGYLLKTTKPWKDSQTDPATAVSSQCHVTFHSYRTGYSYGDGYSQMSVKPAGEQISVMGQFLGAPMERVFEWLPGTEDGNIEVVVERALDSNWQVLRKDRYIGYFPSSYPSYSRDQVAFEESWDGSGVAYEYVGGNYSGGTFSPGSGSFVQKTSTLGSVPSSPGGVSFVPGQSTRLIEVFSPEGFLVSRRKQAYDGSTFQNATTSIFGYNAEGKCTSETRDGFLVYEAAWIGDRLDWEKNESGVLTSYTYDSLSRIETETRQGVVTTYSYDAEDRIISTVRASGSQSLSSSTQYDAAGRILNEQSEEGLVTSYSYTNGGRTVTKTLPNSGTEITDHYIDGQVKSVTGTAVTSRYYDYNVSNIPSRGNAIGTKQSIGSVSSPRWTIDYQNILGDSIQQEQPRFGGGTLVKDSFFNTNGLLVKRIIPGTADELYTYGNMGDLVLQGRDVNSNEALDANGRDPLMKFTRTFANEGGIWYDVRKTERYETAQSSTSMVLLVEKQLFGNGGSNVLDKKIKVDRYGKTVTTTTTVNRAASTVTSTSTASDSSISAVSTVINGQLRYRGSFTTSATTALVYDAMGRIDTVTDPYGVVTDYNYTGALLTSVTNAGETRSMQYYPNGQAGAGKLWTTTFADGRTEINTYDLIGNLTDVTGTGAYKTKKVFDGYGDQIEFYTYRTGSTGDKTTYSYDSGTGLLLFKEDAAGKKVQNAYNAANQLQTKTNARSAITTYSHDEVGNVNGIKYSDGTPAVSVVYDRANRPATLADASGVHSFSYTLAAESKTTSVGLLKPVVTTKEFDSFGRLKSLILNSGGTHTVSYGYDAQSRLQTVGLGSNLATYSYVPNSNYLATTTFTQGASTRLTTTRNRDTYGRFKKITHAALTSKSLDTTLFDSRNRRKDITLEDSSKWTYVYDGVGQVTSGGRTWSDASSVAGQQYGYGFDQAGNRISATVNGTALGWASNSLNQMFYRQVPGVLAVIGNAASGATVTVNGAATTRKGSYFYNGIAVSYVGQAPSVVTQTIAATLPSGTTTTTRTTLVPYSPEVYAYDFDGNLTQDGLWDYTWDAENRLVGMQSRSNVPAAQKRKLSFVYDWMGRRVEKSVWHWDGTAWLLHDHTRSVYNGWILQAEINDSGVPIRSYAWGLGIDGTVEGSGGVGGLLFETNSYGGKTHAAAADLNGNVIRLVDMNDGQTAADYEYGPFGEMIRASGEYAVLNPFGFSSKYTDRETGLLYYGYRYYNPNLGKWISRDPIAEKGGSNLYGFVKNDPVNLWDYLGLDPVGEWISAIYFGNWNWQWQWFEDDGAFEYRDDGYATMASKTKLQMDKFYKKIALQDARDNGLPLDWRKIKIPAGDTEETWVIPKMGGGFFWESFPDVGFWLSRADRVDARKYGTFEARCSSGPDGGVAFEIRNTRGKFRWYDEIDSNPSPEDGRFQQFFETLNLGAEAITGADFLIRIDWEDNRPQVRSLPES